jgi:hypothetical protein
VADPWTITARAAAGSPSSATQAAPASAGTTTTTNRTVVRLRALQCRLSGSAAGTDLLVVRDGATGAGTIIWQQDLSVPANGSDSVNVTGLDLRATPGNGLTVEFVSGVASDREDVNAQGDFVPQGYPIGQP